MSELMLVNPRRRKRRVKRKMTAKQAKYFAPRRKSRRRRRVALAATPAPHRRRSRRRRSVTTHRRRVTRLRRNPIRLGGFSVNRFLNDTLMPAGVGAAGALGVDLALGYLGPNLPASLQTGFLRSGVKIAAAIGLGMLASSVAGKRYGEQVLAGAVTVTLYDILKTTVKQQMPSLPLSDYDMGWVSPGLQIGAYVGSDNAYSGMMPGVAEYVSEVDSDYY